jgi:adenylylsulfate kinase
VYVDCSLATCEERDPKGLYKKARAGQIPNFTGISAPYEAPENPELHLHNDEASIDDNVQRVLAYLEENHYISRL